MIHKPRQVRQTAWDAVLPGGLEANRPAHPPLSDGVDRVRQGLAPEQPVLDIVCKVASEMAVIASGQAALAWLSIVRQKPQASFWVAGIWMLVMVISPSG